MPTKHEGKCDCEVGSFGDFTLVHGPTCNVFAKQVDGAGMREEFREEFYSGKNPEFTCDAIADWWLSRLSRLHSQIIEEVEKEKKSEDHVDPQDRWEAFGYNQALRTSKDIINHAFKDL